jgi:hypothetical protein
MPINNGLVDLVQGVKYPGADQARAGPLAQTLVGPLADNSQNRGGPKPWHLPIVAPLIRRWKFHT